MLGHRDRDLRDPLRPPFALAWKTVLVSLENTEGVSNQLLITYARAQIGKYLPGNVAHIAGRHVVSTTFGYSHPPLVLSILYEFLGLLSAAGPVSALALLFTGDLISGQF